MARERIERRLAAILSADVVGYSRLMGEDEAGTLARLKAHRAELVDPTIAEHQGRIGKLMGDGTLVEFPSVVDAVECAVAVREEFAENMTDEAFERIKAPGWQIESSAGDEADLDELQLVSEE